MSDNLKKFMEEVSKDKTLMERAKKADVDALVAMAKELNLELTEEDLKAPEMGELSDDELASVAGGVGYCECAFSGDGASDGLSCGCYILGNGEGNVKNDKY